MKDLITGLGMILMVALLIVMSLPSLLIWRDERRAEAQKVREQRSPGAATTSE